MIQEFEAAGIAAVCVEDKAFPKINSFAEGRQDLAPIKEFVGKIAAAKEAQRTEGFQMFARVEALIAGWGIAAALERAHAYSEAGADAILIHSKSKNSKEILEFIEKWKLDTPLVLVPTTYPELNIAEIESLGKVGMVIYANHALRAGIQAMRDTLSTIYQTGSTLAVEDDIASVRDVFDLQDMPEFLLRRKRYAVPAPPIESSTTQG